MADRHVPTLGAANDQSRGGVSPRICQKVHAKQTLERLWRKGSPPALLLGVNRCSRWGEQCGGPLKTRNKRSSHCGSVVKKPTSIHEVPSSIPGLAQWVKDPAWP